MVGTTQIRAGVVIAGRYRIIDRLGHGGMATVFLAEDLVLSRQVAVKRLHTAAAELGAERFRREAQLGASLNHPNVVAVYDTISGPDGVLLVMEYVPGPPLSSLIHSGPREPQEAIRILRGVAAGLDYAHARGVVHRDVKPANILVRDDGGVKLGDLGVATAAHLTRITATHDVLGTLTYIAPERLEGEAGGPPADVYSLAAVAFEALSGQPPTLGGSPAELLYRVATEPPPDLRGTWRGAPAAAATVLRRGLDPDPERRPSGAGRMIDELDAGLARGAAAVATPRHARPVTITVSPRNLLRATLIGGLLAVIATVVVLLVNSGGGGAPAGRVASAGGHGSGAGHGAGPPNEGGTSPAPATPASPPPPPAPAADASGAQLNDEGYSLIQQGRYAEAV